MSDDAHEAMTIALCEADWAWLLSKGQPQIAKSEHIAENRERLLFVARATLDALKMEGLTISSPTMSR